MMARRFLLAGTLLVATAAMVTTPSVAGANPPRRTVVRVHPAGGYRPAPAPPPRYYRPAPRYYYGGGTYYYQPAYYRPYYYQPAPAPVAYGPSGWYVGLGLVGSEILNQSGGPEQLKSGAGLSVWGGLRLNERLSLELGWMETLHNPATVNTWYGYDVDHLVLDGWTADARIHLSRSGGLDPYIQGGVGIYALGSQYFGLDNIGTGFQLGGGFDWWIGNFWTLGLRARYHGIAMGPPNGTYNDTFISAAVIEGSLALHF